MSPIAVNSVNQPLVPLFDTPCIMYLRQQMNRMNNGSETMQTAAIFKVFNGSDVL